MKASIIIPAYNVGKYIAESVESAMRQTYRDIEIIIINDGSTDNTLEEVYRATKGDNRCIVINQSNTGVYIARKNALETATGEYVFFLDGDDTLEPFAIGKMMEKAKAENLDICSCNARRVTDSYSCEMKEKCSGILTGYGFFEKILYREISVWLAKLYRRDILSGCMDLDIRIKSGEDRLVNLSAGIKQPRAGFVEEICLNYFQRSGSASRAHLDFSYMTDYNKVVQKIICADDNLKDNIGKYSLADILWWYKIYIRKSSNPWIGNYPESISLYKSVTSDEFEIKKHLSAMDRMLIRLYRFRIARLLFLAMTTAERLSCSLRRRINK